MSYKCCIFDLDGTLLNTLADLECGCNTVLTLMGFPKLKEELIYYYTVGYHTEKRESGNL